MADNTHIEWTDATWNPITGCSVVSPGCTNCYAMKLAGTRLQHEPSRKGLTKPGKGGPVWTGEVRFNEQWLDQPLRWKKPRKIFVCAHGDLFAENVPDAWIDQVFAVMALSPQHTFQVLTKRAKRMREYLAEPERAHIVARRLLKMWVVDNAIPNPKRNITDETLRLDMDQPDDHPMIKPWPLPNVWLGVSVEDQARANERIPDLLATPAAVRWISAEPLLGPINLRRIRIAPDHHTIIDSLDGYAIADSSTRERASLDWVVVGGESGPGARPMHPDWARSIRDQCAEAGVAFHFKQWGEFYPEDQPVACGHEDHDPDRVDTSTGEMMFRVGKARAGRLLDSIEHNGFPEVNNG